MLKIVAFAFFALAACMWAASPLGSLSSAQSFDLNGCSNVPVAGVPNWPVTAGDTIATHSAPATIQFRDGSRVILAENSTAKLEAKSGQSVLRLLQGSGEYTLASHPALSIFVLGQRVTAKSANGQPVPFCVGGGREPKPPKRPVNPPAPPPHPSPCR